MLADGTYDVFVVDATTEGDGLRLDVTILDGAHKGDVLTVHSTGMAVDELDALGLPGTLTVQNGEPTITLDR